MKAEEKLQPTGHLVVLVRKAGSYQKKEVVSEDPLTHRLEKKEIIVPVGKIEQVVEGKNLVLNRMKTQLSHLVVGHENTTRYINRMAWGTGGHIPGDPSQPIDPQPEDGSLESPILIKPLAQFDFLTSTSVVLVAYLLEGEANGFTITESGLVCGDNTLVARRTFAGLAKTADFVFEFRHSLMF